MGIKGLNKNAIYHLCLHTSSEIKNKSYKKSFRNYTVYSCKLANIFEFIIYFYLIEVSDYKSDLGLFFAVEVMLWRYLNFLE